MTDVLADLAAAVGDGQVWLALGVAGVAVVLLVLLGVPIARRVGLVAPGGDATETFSIGLSVGLVAFSAGWAAVASGGRSVFVPVAVLLLAAIVAGAGRPTIRLRLDRQSLRGGAVVAAVLVALGLLYATTIAPSPRDGFQPIEFFDVGYYSVLGADLADTGVETIYSPAGFDQLAGLPEQTWYHWGELWLAAAAIDLSGVSALHARHLVVLPILLLAAAALVGTLVRRLVAPTSTELYVHGAAAMLFLAPLPLVRDLELEWFARSLVIGITQQGLSVVVIVLGIWALASGRLTTGLSGALIGGTLTAATIAAHIGLAAVVVCATGAVVALAFIDPRRRPGALAAAQSRAGGVAVAAALSGALTLLWGYLTGHGLGGLGQIEGVGPFDDAWRRAIVETLIGGGLVVAAPIVWLRWWRGAEPLGTLVTASIVAVVVGTIAWGALVADLNTFHLLFGTIAAVLTPISIVAALWILARLRVERRRSASAVVLTLFLGQLVVSAMFALIQLGAFGPLVYDPTPVEALSRLRALPPGSKAAYGCRVVENFAPWDASLISLDAHTGVRMVPMCFMADRQRRILGRDLDPTLESPFFRAAPQRALYPDPTARPNAAAIESFLRSNGIDYVYTDAAHPDPLVAGAAPVFAVGGITVYRLPPAAP